MLTSTPTAMRKMKKKRNALQKAKPNGKEYSHKYARYMLRAANRNDPNGLISVTIRKLQRDTNMKLETKANELHTGFLMAIY